MVWVRLCMIHPAIKFLYICGPRKLENKLFFSHSAVGGQAFNTSSAPHLQVLLCGKGTINLFLISFWAFTSCTCNIQSSINRLIIMILALDIAFLYSVPHFLLTSQWQPQNPYFYQQPIWGSLGFFSTRHQKKFFQLLLNSKYIFRYLLQQNLISRY